MFLSYLLAGLRTWLKHREAVRLLSEMSDRELHDLGISRHEIRAAVNGQIR
jgi:uncharacterized protein YjiS (DUF1127 family)